MVGFVHRQDQTGTPRLTRQPLSVSGDLVPPTVASPLGRYPHVDQFEVLFPWVVGQEQERIRNNMAQLPRDSDLFRRYVTKFTEQEDQVDALRKQVTGTVAEEEKLKKALNEYLVGLELT